jgi:hypothetical protein
MPNAQVASARLLQATRIDQYKEEEWQARAWHYWATIGEFRRGTEWLARGCSRCRLVAAERNPDGDEPTVVTEGPAAELIQGIDLVCGGQANLIEATSIYLSVPGIGFHVGWKDEETGDYHWEPHSNEELRVRGGRWQLQRNARDWLTLPEESVVVQIWRPDRRRTWCPDSPAKAVLKDLREIELITDHIQAGMVSRLAGAGILFIPDEIIFPGSRDEYNENEDPFVVDLMDMMMTPLKDRQSASAVVPMVVKVPGDYVEKIKHITLQVPLDERSLEQRDSSIRRLAVSLDIPAEVLTGMGDVNHWGQWQIEETAVKLHIEPMMQAIAYGLTVGFLQPTLKAMGVEDPDLIVWYDASELHVRPDRSEDSFKLYDRGELKGEALRRETGVSEEDAPDKDDLAEWAFKRLIDNPDTAAAALAGLGIIAPKDAIPVSEASPGLPAGQPGASPPPGDPNPPAPPGPPQPGTTAALLEACDGLVCRAMETAGNRLRQAAKIRNTWASDQVHIHLRAETHGQNGGDLLRDAFPRVEVVAARFGIRPDSLETVLWRYAADLIDRQHEHTFERMTWFLHEAAPTWLLAQTA